MTDALASASPRPTVSVIIPTNKGGPFLAEAVASLRLQTETPLEVILVDDGSPAPGLAEVARDLGVTYVRQEAAGLSAARNRGVARACGEWVAFLDDDDVWFPDKIAAQLDALQAEPQAIALYSDMSVIDEDSQVIDEVTAPVGSSLEILGRGLWSVPPVNTLMIRRDAYIVAGGCEPGLRWAEDIDLILRLLRAGSFAKAPQSLVGYRRHGNQTSSRQWPSNAAYLSVLRRLIARARRTGDRAMEDALRRHLQRSVAPIADWWAGELISRLGHGRFAEAGAVLGWGLRWLRLAALPAVVRVAPQKLAMLRP